MAVVMEGGRDGWEAVRAIYKLLGGSRVGARVKYRGHSRLRRSVM
jgi:hypothetical protein